MIFIALYKLYKEDWRCLNADTDDKKFAPPPPKLNWDQLARKFGRISNISFLARW
jgi:hypothetical protein